eukprot:scaffold125423_cov31-Tisochrysis_lutea.AAC.1
MSCSAAPSPIVTGNPSPLHSASFPPPSPCLARRAALCLSAPSVSLVRSRLLRSRLLEPPPLQGPCGRQAD